MTFLVRSWSKICAMDFTLWISWTLCLSTKCPPEERGKKLLPGFEDIMKPSYSWLQSTGDWNKSKVNSSVWGSNKTHESYSSNDEEQWPIKCYLFLNNRFWILTTSERIRSTFDIFSKWHFIKLWWHLGQNTCWLSG